MYRSTREPTAGVDTGCGCFQKGETAVVPAVVLDPFTGSGTTTLAASNLGPHAIGIELREE